MKVFKQGVVQCQVPDDFDAVSEEDSTVVTAGRHGFQFRLSAIGVMKSGILVPNAGYRYVEDRSHKERREMVKKDGRIWFKFPDTDIGGDEGTTTWYIGIDTHVIIISAWVVDPASVAVASFEQNIVSTIESLALIPEAAEPGATAQRL